MKSRQVCTARLPSALIIMSTRDGLCSVFRRECLQSIENNHSQTIVIGNFTIAIPLLIPIKKYPMIKFNEPLFTRKKGICLFFRFASISVLNYFQSCSKKNTRIRIVWGLFFYLAPIPSLLPYALFPNVRCSNYIIYKSAACNLYRYRKRLHNEICCRRDSIAVHSKC